MGQVKLTSAPTDSQHAVRLADIGAVRLSKFDATAAPAVTNDDSEGYGVGSNWYDITNDDAYVCLDASTGAAVWKKTTP